MKLIDTHAHLDHIEDLTSALDDASRHGIAGIVAVSTNTASSLKNLEIRRLFGDPSIHVAAGIHPSDAEGSDPQACVDLIRSRRDEVAAVGEIGLDFWYKDVRKDPGRKEEQREVFRALLHVAGEFRLPAVIHARGTWRECLETAKDCGIKKAVFHWYSGPLDVLKDILDSGYYISASPALSYSPPLRAAVDFSPVDRILIETDSPVSYRFPGNERPGNSEDRFQSGPKDVIRALRAFCELKHLDEVAAAEALNRNAVDLFGLRGL